MSMSQLVSILEGQQELHVPRTPAIYNEMGINSPCIKEYRPRTKDTTEVLHFLTCEIMIGSIAQISTVVQHEFLRSAKIGYEGPGEILDASGLIERSASAVPRPHCEL